MNRKQLVHELIHRLLKWNKGLRGEDGETLAKLVVGHAFVRRTVEYNIPEDVCEIDFQLYAR